MRRDSPMGIKALDIGYEGSGEGFPGLSAAVFAYPQENSPSIFHLYLHTFFTIYKPLEKGDER